MSGLMFQILLLFGVLFVDPVSHVSFIVSASVALVARNGAKSSFGWLFVFGLIYDIRTLGVLGVASLVLVSMGMLMELFVHRFDQGKTWWVIGFGLLFSLVWHTVLQPPLELHEAIFETGLAVLLWVLASRFSSQDGVYLRDT